MGVNLRAVCEHEAAHAVAGLELGAGLAHIVVYPDGSGETVTRYGLPAAQSAIIAAAGDLWDREYSTFEYVDGSCFDLQHQVARVGVHGIWAARRSAREILTERRRDVLDLAVRLHRERRIVFA